MNASPEELIGQAIALLSRAGQMMQPREDWRPSVVCSFARAHGSCTAAYHAAVQARNLTRITLEQYQHEVAL